VTTWVIGLFWLLVAGLGQGAFPLPMKYMRLWKWEHLWFWYSAIAFFLLPWVIALATVPHIASVYRSVPDRALWLIVFFGVTWGIGSVFFGLGIDALGMALGFPIMTGLTTALGAFIPMLILTPDLVLKRNGLFIIAGNAITIAGVCICAAAGDKRDRQLGRTETSSILGPGRSFAVALTICILSGVLSAMFNFGYAFGERITKSAIALGSTPDNAVNAVWLVMLPAGGMVNAIYCIFLFRKNRSGALLFRNGSWMDWTGAASMAILWTGSVIVYGWGANALGKLGPTLGWSIWNSILITTTVLCGLLTHEWDGVRGDPLKWLWSGVTVLIVGMFVLGFGVQ
jgi:L-rhamnose-H+ transport protein